MWSPGRRNARASDEPESPEPGPTKGSRWAPRGSWRGSRGRGLQWRRGSPGRRGPPGPGSQGEARRAGWSGSPVRVAAVTRPAEPRGLACAPQFPALLEFEVVCLGPALCSEMTRADAARSPDRRPKTRSWDQGIGDGGPGSCWPLSHRESVPGPDVCPWGLTVHARDQVCFPVCSRLRVTPTDALRLDRNSLSGSPC